MPARPFGRSLADFGTLSTAEQQLLKSCPSGIYCVIAEDRPGPDEKTVANVVRAGFLRFLILGGDDENPVHEHGVRIQGAWIDGVLDLEGVASTSDVWMTSCWLDQTPDLRDAHIKGNFVLSGSRVPGLNGDRLTCDAALFFRTEFLSDGEVRLSGATIGGGLICSGATFNGALKDGKPAGNALNADSVNVKGAVFLNDRFTAHGTVWLLGAMIGGSFECSGATLNAPSFDGKPDGHALNADRIRVNQNVFLDSGFTSRGTVWLTGAVIGGTLTCAGAWFNTGAKSSICAQGMSVAGAFLFRNLAAPANDVNLSHAKVRILWDDREAWGKNLDMDGFTYERIDGESPKDAAMRLAWLDKQSPECSGRDGKTDQFRPQPWLQLHKVLQDEGQPDEARKVGIAFEDRRRHCGQVTGAAKGFHLIYGFFTGYGYRPMRLLGWSLGVWLACGAIYDFAAYHEVFVPTDSAVYEKTSDAKAEPVPANWAFHPPFGGHYPAFHPFAYSLNVFLPVVDLGQEAAWAPVEKPFSPVLLKTLCNFFTDPGSIVQLLIWVETLLGWLAGLLLVAVVSGLARKQDES